MARDQVPSSVLSSIQWNVAHFLSLRVSLTTTGITYDYICLCPDLSMLLLTKLYWYSDTLFFSALSQYDWYDYYNCGGDVLANLLQQHAKDRLGQIDFLIGGCSNFSSRVLISLIDRLIDQIKLLCWHFLFIKCKMIEWILLLLLLQSLSATGTDFVDWSVDCSNQIGLLTPFIHKS